MDAVLLRRKRLADGTFGELENVFGGETDAEKIENLKRQNKDLMLAVTEIFERVLTMGGDGE